MQLPFCVHLRSREKTTKKKLGLTPLCDQINFDNGHLVEEMQSDEDVLYLTMKFFLITLWCGSLAPSHLSLSLKKFSFMSSHRHTCTFPWQTFSRVMRTSSESKKREWMDKISERVSDPLTSRSRAPAREKVWIV